MDYSPVPSRVCGCCNLAGFSSTEPTPKTTRDRLIEILVEKYDYSLKYRQVEGINGAPNCYAMIPAAEWVDGEIRMVYAARRYSATGILEAQISKRYAPNWASLAKVKTDIDLEAAILESQVAAFIAKVKCAMPQPETRRYMDKTRHLRKPDLRNM